MRLARPGAAQIPSGWRPKRSAKAPLASSARSVRFRRSVDITPIPPGPCEPGVVDEADHGRPAVGEAFGLPGTRPTENTCTTWSYPRFPSRAVLVVHRAVGVRHLMKVMQLIRRPACRDHHLHLLCLPRVRTCARG